MCGVAVQVKEQKGKRAKYQNERTSTISSWLGYPLLIDDQNKEAESNEHLALLRHSTVSHIVLSHSQLVLEKGWWLACSSLHLALSYQEG
jgi:hypothetical protein